MQTSRANRRSLRIPGFVVARRLGAFATAQIVTFWSVRLRRSAEVGHALALPRPLCGGAFCQRLFAGVVQPRVPFRRDPRRFRFAFENDPTPLSTITREPFTAVIPIALSVGTDAFSVNPCQQHGLNMHCDPDPLAFLRRRSRSLISQILTRPPGAGTMALAGAAVQTVIGSKIAGNQHNISARKIMTPS